METKFDLSLERDNLKRWVIAQQEMVTFEDILTEIEKQDKEFIRLLKDKKKLVAFEWQLKDSPTIHKGTDEMISIDDLNELAGKSLTEGGDKT